MTVRPLKLALVTRRFPPMIGGAEKVLSYLASALAVEGADVTVLTSRMPGMMLPAHEDVPFFLMKNGRSKAVASAGRLAVVRLETSRLRFWGTWRYMHHLTRWFYENPVDVAYVSMLKHDAYSVIGAGERLGFPVVLRPEGAGATGDIVWQSWGNFGRTIGRRCRRACAFVSISKAIEQELRDSYRAGTMRPPRSKSAEHGKEESPRIVAIPNGVPVPDLAWQRRLDWQAAPRAVFVGRLAAEKGLDVLVAAWPLVRARHPEARLTLIGDGPQRPALEEMVRTQGMMLGPGQAVDIPGAVPEPGEVLREADLFILPSREEGMSIALLEAMALGIPLVASSIAGNRRLVSDFKHGRLAPADDPKALAGVIVDQWDNFDRAFHMSRAARSRVEQEFSIQAVARKHLALFEDILKNQRQHERRPSVPNAYYPRTKDQGPRTED
jgi:glycosyltransferase involved in cell wall biosynthesis